MNNNFLKYFIFLSLISFQQKAFSRADLLITPNRLVLEQGQRSAKITISNPGDEIGNYKVELVNKKMLSNGKLEDDNAYPMDKNIKSKMRFSPRKFSIGPQKTQVIRVMLRDLAKLNNGEYRTHLRVKLLPKASKNIAQNEEFSINIRSTFSISIPMIVKKGKLDSKIKVESASWSSKSADKVALVEISRSGSESPYGDLKLVHIQEDGSEEVVSLLKGVSIYAPLKKRVFKVKPQSGSWPTGGKLKVLYSSSGKKTSMTYTESELKL